MYVGDLVWWDGFFHKNLGAQRLFDPPRTLHPKDYALPGIIVKQASHHQFEVMLADGVIIVADAGQLVLMYRQPEII